MNKQVTMYKLPKPRSATVRCAQHPYSGGLVVPAPWTLHSHKLVCPKCFGFIGWVNKPVDVQPVQETVEVEECA